MKRCRMRLGHAFGVLTMLSLASPTLCAQPAPGTPPGWLVFGGAQTSGTSSYSYLGALKPFEGSRLGEGTFHRTIASWLAYEYETTLSGRRTMVKARAPGIETGVGHAWKRGATQWEASLSVGVRDTDIDPGEVDNDVRGVKGSLTPQVAFQHPLWDGIQAEGRASYSFGPQDRYAMARLVGTTWLPGWRTGVQVSHQEGQTYRNVSAGLFAGKDLAGGWRLELGAGQILSLEGESDPYAMLAFSWLP